MSIPAALSYKLTASGVVVAGRALFRGFSYAETGADVGSVAFYDGASTGDTAKPLVPTITLAANQSDVVSLGAMVASVERGIMCIIVGTVTVVTFANPETTLLHELALFDDGTSDLTDYALFRRAMELGAIT